MNLLLLQPAALRRIMGKLERSNQRKQLSRDFENVFPSPTLRILLLLQFFFLHKSKSTSSERGKFSANKVIIFLNM